MKNKEDRRYFFTLFGGKLLGLAVLWSAYMAAKAIFGGSNAWGAEEAASATAAAVAPVAAAAAAGTPAYVNPINTAWVLLGAFLVFGMQAGFTMLEAGFCREKETVNVLVECLFDTCVCGLLHWGFGFAFMFGGGNAFIGWHLPGDPSKSLIFMQDVELMSTYGAS